MESTERDTNSYGAGDSGAPPLPADAAMGPLASRQARLAAAILDSLMTGLWFAPIYLLLTDQLVDKYPAYLEPVAWVAMPLGIALVGFNIWLLGKEGQTIAKRWMKVRITRADGSRCGLARLLWLRCALPTLVGAIPCAGPLFSLVDALMIFQDDHRCIHDPMADTIVVIA
jgi:uncharacterized RDD family membrane protein YckC